MIVEVKLFAAARQFAGCDALQVELGESATARDLRRALAAACPSLEPLLASSMVAVNHDYVNDEKQLPAGAEVALIPPVSGG